MRILAPWTKQYLAIIGERRDMAFIAWRRSGYRDTAKHAEFLRWYIEANRVWQAALRPLSVI